MGGILFSRLVVIIFFAVQLMLVNDAAAKPVIFYAISESFTEIIDKQHLISTGGERVLGINCKKDIIDEDALSNISVYTGKRGKDGKLIVTVTSADGRYTGRAEYDISADSNTWVQLDYPTQKNNWLKKMNYSSKDLGILARFEGAEAFVLTSWGPEEPPKNYSIHISVNAEQSDTQVLYLENDTIKYKSCNKLHVASTQKYDTVCEISQDIVSAEKESFGTVYLARSNGNQVAGNIEIKVDL